MKGYLLASFVLGLMIASCGNLCGKTIPVPFRVLDEQGNFVVGANVDVTCVDADDGTERTGRGLTDYSGKTTIVVDAPLRDCPSDKGAVSSYFSSCEISVNANGFMPTRVTLSGDLLNVAPGGPNTQSPPELPITLSRGGSDAGADSAIAGADAGL